MWELIFSELILTILPKITEISSAKFLIFSNRKNWFAKFFVFLLNTRNQRKSLGGIVLKKNFKFQQSNYRTKHFCTEWFSNRSVSNKANENKKSIKLSDKKISEKYLGY